MYFFSLYFQNQIPFDNLLIHGLIRDENGKKMSKSLGNGIDPMKIIDDYGSDSLRWYLLTNSSPGLDINFSIEKLKNAWSLCNKIWNISRYIKQLPENSSNNYNVADIWIVNSLLELKKSVDQKIDKYEFTIIGKEITNFIYNDFSSWYIEFSKVNQNKNICLSILKNLLILIHPFLPFLTDHLYFEIFKKELLENEFDLKSIGNESKMQTIIDVVSLIREARNVYNISNKEIVNYQIVGIDDKEIIELVLDKIFSLLWISAFIFFNNSFVFIFSCIFMVSFNSTCINKLLIVNKASLFSLKLAFATLFTNSIISLSSMPTIW